MNARNLGDQEIYRASVGSMMVGLLLVAFFGGSATLQTALYFVSNYKDHWAHKISITLLWISAIVQLSFIFHATYFYAITKGVGFTDPAPFIWSFKVGL
ncbi:hypothetical protein L218DRAFT_880962 [Marasmius fiardii PR-910]|nr:hypothetical protein L218DRAFT_880962 [Marasmius fiardii PR-910]